MYIHARTIRFKVHDHRHLVCAFPKADPSNRLLREACPGSTQIIQAMGRSEALKPIQTPGNGSCWALAFLLATIGNHNQLLVHELRLSCLVYLLIHEDDIVTAAQEREICVDIKQDILDLTSHSAVRKRPKSKDCSVLESEGFGSWVALFCLSKMFDVKIYLRCK